MLYSVKTIGCHSPLGFVFSNWRKSRSAMRSGVIFHRQTLDFVVTIEQKKLGFDGFEQQLLILTGR